MLTCTKCTELIITGKGLPANERVRVGVVDVKTGQATTNQFYVQTDADGAFLKKIPMDLGEHPTLESTVWKQDTNNVLVVAAHSRFTPTPASRRTPSPSPGRTRRCCSASGWPSWPRAGSSSAAHAGPDHPAHYTHPQQRPWPRGSPGPRRVWTYSVGV